MTAPFQPKTFQWVSGSNPEDNDFFTGIIVSEFNGQLAGLYRVQDGNAEIAVVEPTATAGLYRIVGAGLILQTREPLDTLAARLRNLSALDMLAFTLAPCYDMPAEIPVPSAYAAIESVQLVS
ncbi:hypothetical protein [Paenibacillus sabinae]|uniref:Uncharacterized protein n=1 Tax=Paenibacillus sabinae T27 TaxID=1268072 RepID=X4ZRB1_9BACL|nr:hypothetical protein [Paenibacillus sabinae]AHV99005.1 hypothetical protein PSAB_20570 [Paenibacillus sabinae T27]